MRLGLGPVKVVGDGVAVLGLAVGVYTLSALFWAWIIMLVLGACHVNPVWPHSHGAGFWSVFFPWGLIAPFVLG